MAEGLDECEVQQRFCSATGRRAEQAVTKERQEHDRT